MAANECFDLLSRLARSFTAAGICIVGLRHSRIFQVKPIAHHAFTFVKSVQLILGKVSSKDALGPLCLNMIAGLQLWTCSKSLDINRSVTSNECLMSGFAVLLTQSQYPFVPAREGLQSAILQSALCSVPASIIAAAAGEVLISLTLPCEWGLVGYQW